MKKRLVVIPVYNEETHIESVLSELRTCYPGPVVFIDDGSTDATGEILSRIQDERVTVLKHEINEGYGKSLIDGFQFALQNDFERLVTMDCDWQHEPCHVLQLFQELFGWDVVSGSRYLAESEGDVAAPADRRQINSQITEIINSVTGFNLTDAFCGFKAYRVAALKDLELTELGYGMPLQFWMQAHYHKLRVKEVAVPRLYPDLSRRFGGGIDDANARLKYYLSVIDREQERFAQTKLAQGE